MHQMHCSELWGGIENLEESILAPGLEASLYSLSASGGKGGDIYYLSVCDNNQLTRIVIADVVGHGEAVSHISQYVYDSMAAHMNDRAGPEILAEINESALRKGIGAMTTAIISEYHESTREFIFASAGHHPVLAKRVGDPRWQEFEVPDDRADVVGRNIPLGVLPDASFGEASMTMNLGDRLMFYTDGLVEAPEPNGALFGLSRLKAVLQQKPESSLEDLRNSVVGNASHFAGGAFKHDDVTLLVLQVV